MSTESLAETPQDDGTPEILEGTAETLEVNDPGTAGGRPPRWALGLIIGLSVLVVLSAVITTIAIFQPAWFGAAPAPTPTPEGASAEQLAALATADANASRETATLRTRVLALEGRIETMGAADDLMARLETLEKKLAAAVAAGTDAEARTEIAALAGRLAAVEQSRRQATTDATAVAEDAVKRTRGLEAALETRGQQLTALEAENKRLTQSMTGLTERLVRMEKDAAASGRVPAETAALVLAAGQLREALSSSAPFAGEMTSLKVLAADDPVAARVVATLEPLAAAGVPTRRMLAGRFDSMARRVVKASVEGEDPGWVDRAMSRLAGIVTVRRTGDDVEGDTPGAVIARSESRLKKGDLAGAVKILEALAGAPAKAASGWLADARARLGADRAAAELNRHVIGRLAAKSPPSGAGDRPAE